MTASAVAQWVYQLDAAFEGTDWHSLLQNLRSVTPEDWLWVPPGGQRSIRDLVWHVGSCKFVYQNHAFGDAHLGWEDPCAITLTRSPALRRQLRGCKQATSGSEKVSRPSMTPSYFVLA